MRTQLLLKYLPNSVTALLQFRLDCSGPGLLGMTFFISSVVQRRRRVRNLISGSDIYYCNLQPTLIGSLVCIIKGTTVPKMFFIAAEKSVNLASIVRQLSVCTHRAPEGEWDQRTLSGPQPADLIIACFPVCFPSLTDMGHNCLLSKKEDMGMLKVVCHISASHLKFSVHA